MKIITEEQRSQMIEAIARVEGLSQNDKWRETKNLLFKINPKMKHFDKDFCEQVAKQRSAQLNEHGASESGNMRHLMEMPEYMLEALIMVDPNLETLLNDEKTSKKTFRKLAQVFPEYRIAEKV